MSLKINTRSNTIESGFETGGSINVTPDGVGDLVLDGLKWPQADGTANQVVETDGAGQLSFATPSGGGAGGGGLLLQRVFFQDGAFATGTTTIPNDDTIPTFAEGDLFMSASITPTRADSILRVSVTFISADSTSTASFYVPLFRDGTGTDPAIAVGSGNGQGTNSFETVHFVHEEVAGSTSSTTFQVRAGLVSAGTLTFSGIAASARMGGTLASSIVIEELAPTASSVFVGGGTGNIVQQVITVDGEVATGTTTTPFDDTIPQITEGTEFITRTITPTNSNNILLIEARAHLSTDVSANILTGHLHVDADADAVASHGVRGETSGNSQRHMFCLLHRQVAGGTSEQTWRFRAGPSSADTIVFNGTASTSTRNLGGVMNSYIMITEIDPGNVLTTQTTDATQTTIGSLSVASGTSLSFTIRGHGREDATGDTFGSKILGVIRNQGGVTALVGALDIVEFNDAGAATWDITAEANDGTDALDIKVTGEAAHTIDWKLTTETIEE